MDDRKFRFLRAVLGEDGAKALAKAAERAPELEAALLPRSIMAWLGLTARSDFEGRIPGNENTYVQFTRVMKKAEDENSHLAPYVAIQERYNPRFRAAFHHVPTGKTYVPKLPIHDFDDVAEQAGVPREEISRGQGTSWISGFVDHQGKFYNRSEATAALGIKPRPGCTSDLESTDYLENVARGTLKSEASYSGTVTIGEEVYSFENASVTHLGACVAVALGADHERVSPTLRDLDIQRLGKNIDTLVKARVAISELKKKALGAQGGQEAPGPAAAPKEPGAPTPPAAPEVKQVSKGPTVGLKPKLPKPPKPSTPSLLPDAQKLPGQRGNRPQLKVTKSQAERKCPVCARAQFRADRFQGCFCFSELAKAVRVTVLDDGYNLEFTKDWDQESILTLAESLGKK